MEKIMEQFNALKLEEKIIIPAGAVLLIAGFLPWYSVSTPIGSFSANGWQSPGALWSMLAILLGVALAVAVALKNFTDVDIPDDIAGFSWAKVQLAVGVAVLGLVVIKMLNHSGDMGFGFYLAIIAAGALALAGVLAYRAEEDTTAS